MIDPRPKPRDPFGPPLAADELRELFRRLSARPWADQEAFVARVNWNLADPNGEARLMAWLLGCITHAEPARQVFALKILDRLPHPKRARHADAFAALLPALDEDLQARLKNAFGPVLGGARKPSKKPAAATAPPQPPKAASSDDLAKLQAFFKK